MNAPRFFFHLIVALFLTIFSVTARAEMADTFNMAELSRSYAVSCDAQAAGRHANILPPHFPGRPQAFLNNADALVLYSPYLTASERQAAEKLVGSVPKYALPIAWRGGAVYVFTRRAMVEAVPALAVEKNWFEDFGLYMEVERRLYIPFEKGEGLRRRSDGTYFAQHWVPTKRDLFRVINHETGHMVDNFLGGYSLSSKGDDGQLRLSNRPDFLAAFHADLSRLKSRNRPISIERIRKLGYYMPPEFEGMKMGIQPSEQRARREVFAELWAEVHGYNSNRLFVAYPETFAFAKSIAAFLKAQDSAAPKACKL